jgi:hypothetical protein
LESNINDNNGAVKIFIYTHIIFLTASHLPFITEPDIEKHHPTEGERMSDTEKILAALAKLREPFPENQISQLPKPNIS